jgi:murein DD-endopeptidase MepM/ murein hydrolase activator NlpD
VYGPFTFAEVEPTLRELFAQQYQLSIVPTVEIRTRTETRIDSQGNTYTVQVQYEWRVLNVTLASTPLSLVLFTRMSFEEWQHFNILMVSRGARQFVGNPFAFNWLPHVSSRYGYRVHPIHGDKRFHWGIDIALPTGTEILAGFDGTVTSVGYDEDGWGNFVVIDNGAGVQALYAHCHTIEVSQGQGVLEGDVIATVGTTGASTGPHLHMEIIRNGRHLNPLFFVFTGEEASIQFGDARPLTPEEFAILYAEARSHLGKPYIYGANGPNAFDCSSFVAWTFRESGIYPLQRTTAQGIFNQSIPIPPSAIRPGDIIFFTRTYSTTDTVTHLGIYVGNGQMIHAGSPVNITSIHTPFWQTHFYSVGRLRW